MTRTLFWPFFFQPYSGIYSSYYIIVQIKSVVVVVVVVVGEDEIRE